MSTNTTQQQPDFKLRYFLTVMAFSLLFFCFSLIGTLSSTVGLFIPQNKMFPFQDSYVVCNGLNGSFGNMNQTQPPRSKQDIADCLVETEKRNKAVQEAATKTGLIMGIFGMIMAGTIWIFHFKLYQNDLKSNSK